MRGHRFTLRTLLVAVALFCAVGAILERMVVRPAREGARTSVCASHLRSIAVAMQAYHATYGCFPPAHARSSDGAPEHSWRVLLLPFLEARTLYDRYRFDEPWNSTHNRELLTLAPPNLGTPVYRCPSARSSIVGETNYVVITGIGTVFDNDKCTSLGDIADGVDQTILVVEVADTGISWTEPRDLKLSDLDFSVGKPTGRNISSYHPRGALILFASGEVRSLTDQISARDLRAMITASGHEHIH